MPSLSTHFSPAEAIATAHRGLYDANRQWWESQESVRRGAARLAVELLEPVRTLLGCSLHVTSWVRCGALNVAVGGRPASKHVLGLAADVVPVGLDLHAAMRIVVAAMKAGHLPAVDEAIIEMGWLHLQVAPEGEAPRQLVLRSEDGAHFEAWA